jgi:hypothetical protein
VKPFGIFVIYLIIMLWEKALQHSDKVLSFDPKCQKVVMGVMGKYTCQISFIQAQHCWLGELSVSESYKQYLFGKVEMGVFMVLHLNSGPCTC